MSEIFVVSHTHWDREWYQPFQEFRVRLVALMDKLLDLLAVNPAYHSFMLDGQTIVLEDYLAVRPEREAEIRHHVRSGRLLVGPWYILPDEFLVHPESIIRNLMVGDQLARRFGAPMALGYIPDPFGHISQLPQILAGLGMEAAALWRGLPDLPTEFLWQGPDETTILVINLRDSYSNLAWAPRDPDGFTTAVRRAVGSLAPHATTEAVLMMDGTDHMEPRPEIPTLIDAANARLGADEGHLLHASLPEYVAAVRAAHPALRTVEGEFRSPERACIVPGTLSARMWIKQRNTASENLLLRWAEPFSAIAGWLDPQPAEGVSPEARRDLIRHAWRLLLQNQPHDSICGCSIDQVHREMRPRFDQVDQIAQEVTRHSLTSIVRLVDTASLSAEQTPPPASGPDRPAASCIPIVVFNPTAGPRTDVVKASIPLTGSFTAFAVQDAAGRETPCQILGRHSEEWISLDLEPEDLLGMLALEEGHILGMIIHDLALQVKDQVAYLDVTVSTQGQPDLSLVERARQEIEGLLAEGQVRRFRVRAHPPTVVDFCFVAQGVPGHGYKVYAIIGAESSQPQAPSSHPLPSDPFGNAQDKRQIRRLNKLHSIGFDPCGLDGSATLTTGLAIQAERGEQSPKSKQPQENLSDPTDPSPSISNEFYRVEVDPVDGTLTITDQATGAIFAGANRFVDGGDRGDEYNYCPPEQDILFDKPAGPPTIALVEDGPARRTLRIEMVYRLPAALTGDRSTRSQEAVEVPITTYVSLSPGLPRIDFRTEVVNRARDHRLRVHFPTPIQTDRSWAEGHFDVVTRPLDLPADTADWIEQPVPTHPQRTFVDVSDGEIGLMVANRGLPEYEVMRSQDGVTVVLTLLRCVGWLSRADLSCRRGNAGPSLQTPEAQCLGSHVFEYALIPHTGDWSAALRQAQHAAFQQAHFFNAPLRAIVTGIHEGSLPPEHSFIEIEPASLVITTIKAAETGDGLIVRYYNMGQEPVEGRLRLWRPFTRAALVNLNEEEMAELEVSGEGGITLPVRGRQIVTIKFQF